MVRPRAFAVLRLMAIGSPTATMTIGNSHPFPGRRGAGWLALVLWENGPGSCAGWAAAHRCRLGALPSRRRRALDAVAHERRRRAVHAAAAAIHVLVVERDHLDAHLGEALHRARRCAAHDHAPRPHGQAVDRERRVIGLALDRADLERLQLLEEPEWQPDRVDDGDVDVGHHEGAVDVLLVTVQLDLQELHAERSQHLFDLPHALRVGTGADADDLGLLVDHREAAALEDPRAVDRPEDRHAERGHGAGDRRLLAASQTGAHPTDDGAAADRDHLVARGLRLDVARHGAAHVRDLNALAAQRLGEAIVLLAHLLK